MHRSTRDAHRFLARFVLGLVVALAAAPARAIPIVIDNGSAPPNPANVLSADLPDAEYQVRDSATGDPTAVLVLDSATYFSLQVFGRSSARVEGGSGGFGQTQLLSAGDEATLVIAGGGANFISVGGRASLILESGGHALGPDSFLGVAGDATATILGGVVAESGLLVEERGAVTIRGGQFVDLFGDTPGLWTISDEGVVTVHGTGFAIDGVPVPAGLVTATGGILTGTLESGEALHVRFSRLGPTARLVLVPEPLSVTLLGVGAAALALRRAQRAHASG